jgi:tRNA-dihydrouridine synthase B
MYDASFFNNSLTFGQGSLPNRVLLAPLAGVSDIPFRRACQRQGAGLTYVEMLSATAIGYRNRRTFEMMARHKDEGFLGVQVTGPKVEEVAKAVEVLTAEGFDTIDINMGCPVRKVVGAGCGSAFLKDQNRLRETIKAAKASTSLPLTIKYRLGYTRPEFNVTETTLNGMFMGADMLTIHGRTRSESYDTPVDLAGIRAGVATRNENESLVRNIPMVGNGDVFCFESAARMVRETGCDAVMVSRGALGNPWVFAEILAGKPVQPTVEEWLDVVFQHLEDHAQHYGKTRAAAVLMRKHLLWYCKGFPGVKSLRDAFNVLEDLDEARLVLKDFTKGLPWGMRRYEGAQSGRLPDGGTAYDPKYEMDREKDRGVGHLTGEEEGV